ncbi:MAG: YfhO family protein [Ruminococcus sp.]|nr:YfhO family protein [Ruminococcus sp.]
MKRYRKSDFLALGGIMLLTLAIMALCLTEGTVYGSRDDWASQHYAIPEYFRTLFYSTHELFPSYAPNLGGGENIYTLSYYGLYSPVIMLSYLLPFVPMSAYIMAASVLSVLFSEGALYAFFRRRFGTAVTACTTLFFALSVPLIINSHRQIMFTGYMPFLLLAMLSADSFFRRGRRAPLILSAFLMIMCNYYFALSALTALACYGVYIVLSEDGAKLPARAKKYLPFAGALAVSVLMAGVLLLPTAHVLISGRSGDAAVTLHDFLPTIRYDRLTYFGYTMGLSAFGVFAAIYSLFSGRLGSRFIAALVLLTACCPAVLYLLNGTLYTDPKVLFAFLPLALIPTAELLGHIFASTDLRLKTALAVFAISSAISAVYCRFSPFILAYLADAALFALGTLLLSKTGRKRFCALFFAVPLISCICGNRYDKLQPLESFRVVNSPTVAELVTDVSDGKMVRTAVDTTRLFTVNKVYAPSHYTDTLYSSVHSQDYNRFYLSEMCSENEYRNSALTTRSRNILFNCRMGNRYYITREDAHFYGLELIKQTPDGYRLYENRNAFPLIWTGSPAMSQRQYESLDYPQNIEALMRYTIVPAELPDAEFTPAVVQADIGDIFDLAACGDISGQYETTLADGTRTIIPDGGTLSYTYELPESVRGKILLLRFRVGDEEPQSSFSWERGGDVRIRINGVKNTLTNPKWKYHNGNNLFEYVISDLSDTLTVELTGRELALSELTAYTLEPSFLDSLTYGLTAFEPDMSRTRGDAIYGRITASADGFADTSFVWHEGYTVLVDSEEVAPIKTDTAFLGFPISAGSHEVEIRFTAPLLGLGKLASAAGLILMSLAALCDIILSNKRTSPAKTM